MYAIYANIYHQYTPFMLAYIPYMDPMGNTSILVQQEVPSVLRWQTRTMLLLVLGIMTAPIQLWWPLGQSWCADNHEEDCSQSMEHYDIYDEWLENRSRWMKMAQGRRLYPLVI